MSLGEAEKEEMRTLAGSSQLREEMAMLAATRSRAFFREGEVDSDRLLAFLCDYNEFINHTPKKFQRIIDDTMKL